MNIGDNEFGGIIAHIFTKTDSMTRDSYVFNLCYIDVVIDITGKTINSSGVTGITHHILHHMEFNTGETHGFVVSSTNIGESAWGVTGFTSATGLTYGSGHENTLSMLNCDGAILCKNYTGDGYSDWVLPSNDEAMKFCVLNWLGFGDFSTGDTYLTSTEIDCSKFGNCYNPDYKDFKLCFSQNINHTPDTWTSDLKYPGWRSFGAEKKDTVLSVRAIRYF